MVQDSYMMDFDCYRTYTTPYPSSADASDGYVRGVCSASQNPSSNYIIIISVTSMHPAVYLWQTTVLIRHLVTFIYFNEVIDVITSARHLQLTTVSQMIVLCSSIAYILLVDGCVALQLLFQIDSKLYKYPQRPIYNLFQRSFYHMIKHFCSTLPNQSKVK